MCREVHNNTVDFHLRLYDDMLVNKKDWYWYIYDWFPKDWYV